jgi:preprotein translocase SecE subunit
VNAVLSFGHRSAQYLRKVREEIRKVTWPTPLDLRRTTLVIIIFVIVIGIIIAIMDRAASFLFIDLPSRLLG